MRLLLDTHVLVWMVTGDSRLRREWQDRIEDFETELCVSAVTAFEFADLQMRKRLPLDEPIDVLIERFDLLVLSLPAQVWGRASSLPDVHRDPVDRMLVAHALEEDLWIMTADDILLRYPAKFV